MIVTTETGSEYEIDLAGRRMRRLSGVKPPTPNMRQDGQWRQYESLTPGVPVEGRRLLVVWGIEDGIIRRTWTSPVSAVVMAPDAPPRSP